ncbi:MAG TPA: hypothetical protein VGY96_09860 [Streptosporangiaceae bacterium]|nr:hypothetical protein [Streptosporangiaceae bacterium]
MHVPAADVKAVACDAVILGSTGFGYSSSVLSGSGLSGSGLTGSGLTGSGLTGSGLSGFGVGGVVEAAEEQRGVGDVLEGFGPVIEVGLEVLLGDRVTAHGLEGEDVFAHEPEVLARALQLVAFRGQDGVNAGPFGKCILF